MALAAIAVVSASFIGSMAPNLQNEARAQTPAPNIVVIMADDMRADQIDDMPSVQSELVGKGRSFEQAFVTDPLCCPSRTSFLRGQYSHTTSVYNVQYALGGWAQVREARLEQSMLPTWMDPTYYTALVGKYLNGYNDASVIPPGWDYWRGMLKPGYTAGSWDASVQGVKESPSQYSTDYFTDRAVEAIDASGSEPVFLWASYYAPHDPFTPAPEYATETAQCGDVDYRTSPSFNEAVRDKADGLKDKPRWLKNVAPLTASQAQLEGVKKPKKACRSLLSVDDGVDDILAALEIKDPGLNNTVVMFTSDQGIQYGEHNYLWKKDVWESTIRIPMVVRADGLLGEIPSADDEHMVLNIDVAPTFLDLAGITGVAPGCAAVEPWKSACESRGSGFDGFSFAPLLRGEPYIERSEFLIEHWDPVTLVDKLPTYCAVRTETQKLVRYYKNSSAGLDWEGYDLSSDPNELHSLVYSGTNGIPRFRGAGKALYDALYPRLARLCDPLPGGGMPEYPAF